MSGEASSKMELAFETLELETRYPFHIARQAAPPGRRSVWVRLRSVDGVEGWGEAAATPYYGETAETASAVLPRYAAALSVELAERPFALERAERALEREVGRNPAARAGISAARHDQLGKRLGQPVWRIWGLDPASAPQSSFTIGIDSPERMRDKMREAAGYPILKVKVGSDRDEEVLALIRDAAPSARLRVDANTAWTAKEAIAKLPLLEAYDVELLEQPLAPEDIEGGKLLRQRSRLPIVADESCRVAADVPRVAAVADVVNIKLAKCGSLREALRIVHTARAHRLGVMLGCMVESTLGIAAALQLAPLVDYVDLDGAALLTNDPFRGPGLQPDGSLRFNGEPGLGVVRG
jgi:L-Ala-D/L-Glu epimerase